MQQKIYLFILTLCCHFELQSLRSRKLMKPDLDINRHVLLSIEASLVFLANRIVIVQCFRKWTVPAAFKLSGGIDMLVKSVLAKANPYQ